MALINAAANDSAFVSVYAQQEGAFVHVSLQVGEDDPRLDALLTPDQAESLSFELTQLAQDARKFGSEEAAA